jgi:hypothetical protein
MSAKEAKMLDELRAKEMKSLSDSEYKIIREQVESKGIRSLKGSSAQVVFAALRERNKAMKKALSVKEGDMVSWDSSGGTARGKVIHVMDYGTLDVPNTDFKIKGEKDDPAVLIQLYRDGEPTDTQVGHKMSTLKKNLVSKHGNHDQRSHGSWSDESEGEYLDTQGLHGRHRRSKDDSEGEFGDSNDDDDMEAMDMMDILRPPKITASQRTDFISPYSVKPTIRK